MLRFICASGLAGPVVSCFNLDMSSKIKILPDGVINKIAAGEVVERPSSVVKELVENSIDAGATDITVDIEQAGKRLIRIIDNGCGMSKEDARIAFERHATSKISSDTDLESVRTMGFRGEALSSIASVSQVRMVTAEDGASAGVLIEIEGGVVKGASDAAAPSGTSLEIAHLFHNTPARLKFLKSPATEFAHVVTALSRQAMSHPSIRFKLTHNKKIVLDLPASQSLKERAFQLYGAEIAENVAAFSIGDDGLRVHGLLALPGYTRGDKTYQDFYVNGRAVRNASLTHALYAAYGDLLMRDRHPAAFIFLEIDSALVDVNVHPAKAEVRFRNQSQVHDLVRDAVREGLREAGLPVQANRAAVRDSPMPAYAERIMEHIADFGSRNDRIESMPFEAPRTLSPAVAASSINPQASIPLAQATLIPLAQVHDSFIIAQSPAGMAIVDQHAAHERVLFEKLKNEAGSNVSVQNLLIPAQVELGPAESNILTEYLPELVRTGLLVEDFGGGTFIIKSVPTLLVGSDYRKLLLDILDELNSHGASRKAEIVRDEVLSVMACHPAIKVHRRLSMREMEQLLTDLFNCKMPHTCPHGRPTVLYFSIAEIEKMFKRI